MKHHAAAYARTRDLLTFSISLKMCMFSLSRHVFTFQDDMDRVICFLLAKSVVQIHMRLINPALDMAKVGSKLLLTSLRRSCYAHGTQDEDLHELGFPKRSATISFSFGGRVLRYPEFN